MQIRCSVQSLPLPGSITGFLRLVVDFDKELTVCGSPARLLYKYTKLLRQTFNYPALVITHLQPGSLQVSYQTTSFLVGMQHILKNDMKLVRTGHALRSKRSGSLSSHMLLGLSPLFNSVQENIWIVFLKFSTSFQQLQEPLHLLLHERLAEQPVEPVSGQRSKAELRTEQSSSYTAISAE